MRELKFRAWLPDEETMLHSDRQHEIDDFMEVWSISNTINVEIQELYWHSPGGNTPEECFKYVTPPQVVMQYTGLKDKAGKEIYEGDIVRDFECEYVNDTFTVYFSDGYWYPLVQVEDGYNCIDNYSKDRWAVIGNEHENPELITP